ncbi:hypothetical protein ACFWGN_17825 [Oerskovia sp. NPDC060338]|uniref:hypothetical protein n=1 Tax=Oerskovia sp. NPDC060338 TaxID=3347100 RepID=UPI003655D2B4
MRIEKLVATFVVLAALTACSPGDVEVTAEETQTTETKVTITTPEPSEPEPLATRPPQECGTPTPRGSDSPVADAAATAVLPETVTLRLGTQVIDSIDEAGMVEAVARICSEPLSKDELTAIATTIAQAIYADPSHETVALLKVSSWVPVSDGSDALTEDQSLDTDYQTYLWDADPSLLPSNWTHNP